MRTTARRTDAGRHPGLEGRRHGASPRQDCDLSAGDCRSAREEVGKDVFADLPEVTVAGDAAGRRALVLRLTPI